MGRSDLRFVVPGRIDRATGGYIYDAAIVAGLRALGRQVAVVELPGRFPDPDAAARGAAARLPAGPAAIDGLALLAFEDRPDALADAVGLIHHPLWRETGLSPARRADFARREAALWRRLKGAIVTGAATAAEVAATIGRDRVAIVNPAAPLPRRRGGRRRGRVLRLLSVGALGRRKGYGVLLRALSGLTAMSWRIAIVGSADRDPGEARRLRALTRFHRLGRRVRWVGEVAAQRMDGAYAAADLFVLASLHEGYGMAFAEALAHRLPVVGTRAGAIAEAVPAACGLLARPGDATALRRALARLIGSRRMRARLAANGHRIASRRPDWTAQATRFAAALDRLLAP